MSARGPLRIVVVCTANICRSPMAAAMLAEACGRRSVMADVSSAGFLFEGAPASAVSVDLMRERGIDISGHRSRVVGADVLAAADLVLTMERRHARDLVLQFARSDIVHTMKGFAALVSALAPTSADDGGGGVEDDVAALLLAAGRARGPAAFLGDGRPDEIADPHGRSVRVHRAVVGDLATATDTIAAGLARAGSRRAR